MSVFNKQFQCPDLSLNKTAVQYVGLASCKQAKTADRQYQCASVDNENLNITLNWERRGNNGSLCVRVKGGFVWGVVQGVALTSQAKMNDLPSA